VLAPIDPLQNNGYSYSANSPVTSADPSGECYDSSIGGYNSNRDCAGTNSQNGYEPGANNIPPPPPPGASSGSKNKSASARDVAGLGLSKLKQWLGSDASRAFSVWGNVDSAKFNEVINLELDCKQSPADPCTELAIQALTDAGATGSYIQLTLEMLHQFQSHGPWDLKDYVHAEYGLWGQDFTSASEGVSIRADVFGNVDYGCQLAKYGVNEDTAVRAADSGGPAGNADPSDDPAVRLGFNLAKKYPNGLSLAQYYDAIASDESLVKARTVKVSP